MTRHCDKSVAEKPDNDQWARLQNAVADMSASVEEQKKAVALFRTNMHKLEVSVGEIKSSLNIYRGNLAKIQTHGKRLRGQMRRLITTVDPWTVESQETRQARYRRAA